ncbi:hypothetical protein BDP27DRAFT_422870 [Rhodocollybia butyracea]|uniref:Uncharacterized protein n=1 Tax=Rhodocollybia butyracea TaxID=206335 RepID=A0A9P5PBR9_9AGAR|nr:hypothetical protein BDP27DRAFT_422870 [Rhodocollybia butyracea]
MTAGIFYITPFSSGRLNTLRCSQLVFSSQDLHRDLITACITAVLAENFFCSILCLQQGTEVLHPKGVVPRLTLTRLVVYCHTLCSYSTALVLETYAMPQNASCSRFWCTDNGIVTGTCTRRARNFRCLFRVLLREAFVGISSTAFDVPSLSWPLTLPSNCRAARRINVFYRAQTRCAPASVCRVSPSRC